MRGWVGDEVYPGWSDGELRWAEPGDAEGVVVVGCVRDMSLTRRPCTLLCDKCQRPRSLVAEERKKKSNTATLKKNPRPN